MVREDWPLSMAAGSISTPQRVFLFSEAALIAFSGALAMAFVRVPEAGTAKWLLAAAGLALFALAPFALFSSGRLLLLVGFLFFPVTLLLGGKDALSLSSALILGMFALFLLALGLRARQEGPARLLRQEKILWIAALLAIAVLGLLKSPRQYWGPEVRHLVNFASSALLFLMLVNWPRLGRQDARRFAERMLVLIIALTCLQVLIGLLVFHWPEAGRLFTLFLVRTKEELAMGGDRAAMKRLSCLNMAVEEIGEFLALLCPLVLWFAFRRNRWFWLVFGLFWLGLLYSNTRSTILLGAASSLLMIAVHLRGMRVREFVPLALCVGAAALVCLLFYSALLEPVIKHLEISWLEWRAEGGVMRVVNREQAWPEAWRVTKATLSLFGNGPAPSRVLGLNEIHMHSLYLTLLFQFGILGALLYLALPFSIAGRLLARLAERRNANRLFHLACLLSLLVFLFNEVKFEFNRADAYQQLIWAMFAVYYLAARGAGAQEAPAAAGKGPSLEH